MAHVSDFTQDGDKIVLDLINESNNTSLNLNDISVALKSVQDPSTKNTVAIVTAKAGSGYVGTRRVEYNRLNISSLVNLYYPEGITFPQGDATTINDFIPEIEAGLAIRLTEGIDYQNSDIGTWGNEPHETKVVTVNMISTSMVYYGSLIITVDGNDIPLSAVVTSLVLNGLNLPVLINDKTEAIFDEPITLGRLALINDGMAPFNVESVEVRVNEGEWEMNLTNTSAPEGFIELQQLSESENVSSLGIRVKSDAESLGLLGYDGESFSEIDGSFTTTYAEESDFTFVNKGVPPLKIVSRSMGQTPHYAGNPIAFSVEVTGGTLPYSYVWTNHLGVNYNISQPMASITPDASMIGQSNVAFTCTVTDSKGNVQTTSWPTVVTQKPEESEYTEYRLTTGSGNVRINFNRAYQYSLNGGDFISVNANTNVNIPRTTSILRLKNILPGEIISGGGGTINDLQIIELVKFQTDNHPIINFIKNAQFVKVPDVLPPVVKSLASMFNGATTFNQNISGWDTKNITDMTTMFFYAYLFNQNLSEWNVSKVTAHDSYDGNANQWLAVNKPKFL